MLEGRNMNFIVTDGLIVNTYLTLCEKKKAEDITVSDVCGSAKINRTTFYRHFKGIWEIQDRLESFFLSRVDLIIERFKTKKFFENPRAFFEEVNKSIRGNLDFYQKCSRLPDAYTKWVNYVRIVIDKMIDIGLFNAGTKELNGEQLSSFAYACGGISILYIGYLRGRLQLTLDQIADEISNSILSRMKFSNI